jgi:hypothetical protein
MDGMSDSFDPFAVSTGLKDDYDGVIVDAWFAKDSSAQGDLASRLQWFVVIQPDDQEAVEEVRFPCGNEWETYDGGGTADHPKGDRQLFNKQTKYGRFVTAAMNSGAEDQIRERFKETAQTPRSAQWLTGYKFHFARENEDKSFKGRDGEVVNYTDTTLLPRKFLGFDGEVAATDGEPKKVDPLESVSPEIAADIRRAAHDLDYSAWVDHCLELAGVRQSAKLVTALGRPESLYDGLRAE